MYKQAKQDLIQAKALIENPKHWTRKAYARDAEGRGVSPHNPSACSFCASGAIHHAVYGGTLDGGYDYEPKLDNRHDVASNLLTFVALEMEGCSLADLNDDFSHEYVMSAYDKAIAMADTTTLTLNELRIGNAT